MFKELTRQQRIALQGMNLMLRRVPFVSHALQLLSFSAGSLCHRWCFELCCSCGLLVIVQHVACCLRVVVCACVCVWGVGVSFLLLVYELLKVLGLTCSLASGTHLSILLLCLQASFCS